MHLYNILDLPEMGQSEVVEQVLYGQILHGDTNREKFFDGGIMLAAYSALYSWNVSVRADVECVMQCIAISEEQESILPLDGSYDGALTTED
ncbi:hypothetical protein [Pseudoclavibacter helvolus]|uniref:hypothetical protein n=1 Tax=Pseudoclavibacter helvolus TaxID=255205 RepID=UPI000839008B|nr:hypothetical protein [Pseudoclavibacter helvolus]